MPCSNPCTWASLFYSLGPHMWLVFFFLSFYFSMVTFFFNLILLYLFDLNLRLMICLWLNLWRFHFPLFFFLVNFILQHWIFFVFYWIFFSQFHLSIFGWLRIKPYNLFWLTFYRVIVALNKRLHIKLVLDFTSVLFLLSHG